MRPLLDKNILKPYLGPLRSVQKPSDISLEEFVKKSDSFLPHFPRDTARVRTLLKKCWKKETLEQKVNSAYPLVHERVLNLAAEFIHYKKQNGSSIERKLYAEMDLVSFFDRLLKKRPYVFYTANDRYMLRNEEIGDGGFEKIGTESEDHTLCMQDYLTYDEMKISALVSVSSMSCFINDGSRHNKGVEFKDGKFEKEGVIIGAVGARLKKKSVMEWQDCIITREQNSECSGYGNIRVSSLPGIWGRMWGSYLPLWDEMDPNKTGYLNIDGKKYFNTLVYRRRIQLTAEVILGEATKRAQSQGRKAYIHVVGLGLGVWRAINEQEEIFVDAWGMALGQIDTTHISDVDFSWIKVDECKGVKDGEKLHGVTLHFTMRSLHDPVPEGTLLVCTYAWDGNSLPGNEYWLEKLCSTGDGAAACSSQVAEIHNTFINPNVCGANLHIASKHGVEHIAQYAQRMTVDTGDKSQNLLGETCEVPTVMSDEWTKLGVQGTSGTRKDKEPSSQKTGELKEKDEVDSGQHQSSKDERKIEASQSQREKKNSRGKGQKGESYRKSSDSPHDRNNTEEVLVKNGDKHKHQKPHGEDKGDLQESHLNNGNRYKQNNITDSSGGSWADDRVNGFIDKEYSKRHVQEKPRRGNRRTFEGEQGFSRNHSRSNSRTKRRNSSKDGFHRNSSRKHWNTEYKDDGNQPNWVAQQGTRKNNNAKEKSRPSVERQDEQSGQKQKEMSLWDSVENSKSWDEDSVPRHNAQSSQLTNKHDRHSARHDKHYTQRQDRNSASRQERHSSRQDRHSVTRQDGHSSSRQNGYSHRQNSHSKHKHDVESTERRAQWTHGQEAQPSYRQSAQRHPAEKPNASHIQSAHSWTQQRSSQNSQTKDADAHKTQHPQGQDAHHSQVQDIQPSQAQDVQPLVCNAQPHQTQVIHPSVVEDKQPSHVQDMQASQVDCSGPLQTQNTLIAGIQTQNIQSSCVQTSETLTPISPQVQSLTNPLEQANDLEGVDGNLSQSNELGPLKTDTSLSSEKAEHSVEKESYLWCEVGPESGVEVIDIAEEKTEQQGKSQSYKGHSSRNPRDFDYSKDMYSSQHQYYSHIEGPLTSGPNFQNVKGYRESQGQWQGRGRSGRGQRPFKGENYHSQTPMESGKPRHSGRGRDYCNQQQHHPGYPHPRTKGKQVWPMDKISSDTSLSSRIGDHSSTASYRYSNNERQGQGRGKSYRGHRNNDNNYNCRIFTSSFNANNARYCGGNQQYTNGFDDKGKYDNCGSPGRGSYSYESRRDPNYSDDVRRYPMNSRKVNHFNPSGERKKQIPTECNPTQREKVPDCSVDTRKEVCSSGVSGHVNTAGSKGEWKESTRDEKDIRGEWKDSVRSKEVALVKDTSNTDPVHVQGEQEVILVTPSSSEESCVTSVNHSIGGGREQANLTGQRIVEEHVSREESVQEVKDYNGDGGHPREPKFADIKTDQQPCRERVASVDDSGFWCTKFESQKENWHQENLVEKLHPVPPLNTEIRQFTQSPAVAFQDQQPLLQHSQTISHMSQNIQLPQAISQVPQAIPPYSQGVAQQPSQPVPPMSQSIPHAVSQLSPGIGPLQAIPHCTPPFSQHMVQPVHGLLHQYPPIHQFPTMQPLHPQAFSHHLQGRPTMNASRQSFSQQPTQASQQASQHRLLHQGQPVHSKQITPMSYLLQQQQQQQLPQHHLNYEQHDTFPPPSEHTSYSSSPHCIMDDSQFLGKHSRVDVSRQNMMSYSQESPLSNSQSSQFSENLWTNYVPPNQLVLQPTLSPGLNQVTQVPDIAMPSLLSGLPLFS
ncbi:uncharacterized protein LOC143036808 [Oratosquilla oratoria]|uniref:uncharacterized protein LOC143036808 n=1 Tax=Oratosquilla oratoria TaxID=337810 RepID=UPI003F775162